MAAFRWVLLLIGVIVLALVFAYSRGLLPTKLKLPRLRSFRAGPDESEQDEQPEAPVEAAKPVFPAPMPAAPRIQPESKVIAVRIMPEPGFGFPAEPLILALRAAGLKHGHSGIFHCPDESAPDERARYSVASLVEPGSFDLSHLKESEYPGISIFTVLPAPENGIELFDQMVATARHIARDIDGRLVDEQGGTLSLQRERYMREEVIEFLHRINNRSADESDDDQDASAAS
jgi:cell division protein ZipA